MSWTWSSVHTPGGVFAKHMGIHDREGQITGRASMIDFNARDFSSSSVEGRIDARTLSTHRL